MESYWNYRILVKRIKNDIQFAIYEVHYENDIPVACTQELVYPSGFGGEEPIETIKWQLDAMKLALDKPILDYDNFPNEYLKYSRLQKLKAIKEFFDTL